MSYSVDTSSDMGKVSSMFRSLDWLEVAIVAVIVVAVLNALVGFWEWLAVVP